MLCRDAPEAQISESMVLGDHGLAVKNSAYHRRTRMHFSPRTILNPLSNPTSKFLALCFQVHCARASSSLCSSSAPTLAQPDLAVLFLFIMFTFYTQPQQRVWARPVDNGAWLSTSRPHPCFNKNTVDASFAVAVNTACMQVKNWILSFQPVNDLFLIN